MLVSLFLAAATATAVAADSIVYPVLNHDRPAGTMVVTRNGDSVRVRYIFTDRNRGTRLEMREVFRGDAIVSMESRPVLATNARAIRPSASTCSPIRSDRQRPRERRPRKRYRARTTR